MATTRRRTFKWIADEEEFKKLLKRVTDLVALKTSSDIAATAASLESPTRGTRSGSGLSELKLAQARKREVQDELYEVFGTTHAEQDTTISLVVPSLPTDLAHNFLGLDLLDHILLYDIVRSRVQIYPIPLLYLQHMKDSFRSESGVRPLDMSTLPPQVAMEFAEQDKQLFIAVYEKLSQGLKDRVDNTYSFNQNQPKIAIQGGVKKHRGIDLISCRDSEPMATTEPVPPKQGLLDWRPVKLDSPSKPGYHSNRSERTVQMVPKRCSWGCSISGNPEIEQTG